MYPTGQIATPDRCSVTYNVNFVCDSRLFHHDVPGMRSFIFCLSHDLVPYIASHPSLVRFFHQGRESTQSITVSFSFRELRPQILQLFRGLFLLCLDCAFLLIPLTSQPEKYTNNNKYHSDECTDQSSYCGISAIPQICALSAGRHNVQASLHWSPSPVKHPFACSKASPVSSVSYDRRGSNMIGDIDSGSTGMMPEVS